jgi:hypothetical protein
MVLVFHFAHAKTRPIFDYDAKGSIVFATAAVWDGMIGALQSLNYYASTAS